MTGFTQKLRSKIVLRIAALATVVIAVTGCTYDAGIGYASDGYGYGEGSGYYDCDPYSPFDNYYDCDNGYGFSNIGYDGGWYDNYWYPGYGFFLFDNYGQRYNMRNYQRRYWSERRHSWYRENLGRNRDGARYESRGYTDNATPGTVGRLERNGGRVRDGADDRRGRGGGPLQRNDEWRGGNGADAVSVPNPEVIQGRGRDEGYGRRQRGDGQGARDGEGRGYRQPPPQQSTAEPSGQSEAPVARQTPLPRREGARQQGPRIRSSEGAVEQLQ